MEQAEAHLLDFSKEFDVVLLDQIIVIAFDPSHPQRQEANQFLVRLKEHPDVWMRAGAILEGSKHANTRFFGLHILSDAITTRWKIIPQEQREGIRSYIMTQILELSKLERVNHTQESFQFLKRLNLVLVQILKQDWPHAWPTFITDLVDASKTSENLCENNMKILKLLIEEIFEFGQGTMTSDKISLLTTSFHSEFQQVFDLCQFILASGTTSTTLIISTLETLQRFIGCIQVRYIFETSLLNTIMEFFKHPQYRTQALDCLVEVAQLGSMNYNLDAYQSQLVAMFNAFLTALSAHIPDHISIRDLYKTRNEDAMLFTARLGMFLSTFLKSYLHIFEKPEFIAIEENKYFLIKGLELLSRVSDVDDDDVFKTCLEFWHFFSKDLHSSVCVSSGMNPSSSGGMGVMASSYAQDRLLFYDKILGRMRDVMIDHMAKPEEVIVVVDEDGNVVRERAQDTDVIAQYKTMKDTIVYLTHLNYDDTQERMLERLKEQVNGDKFSWGSLNTLCWAIGTISTTLSEQDERRFLVAVIKDLLKLCEEQRGKNNKAVVASNIMYIVGQYPRFLKARPHWRFLKTVVNKLFEFMHEKHPGVQDMACDTFLKIAQKCKRKFMTQQGTDTEPYVLQLITDLPSHTFDLEPHQVQAFYEAVACMLSDTSDQITIPRDKVMLELTKNLNAQWNAIIVQGATDPQQLINIDIAKELSKILKCNIRICKSAGSNNYIHQLSSIFLDALHLYHLYGESIKTVCVQHGEVAIYYTLTKALRVVKGDILELVTTFLEKCPELDDYPRVITMSIMPPLMKEVLVDYKTSPKGARDAKVLLLFSAAVSSLREHIAQEIPKIMEYIFEPSLELITENMTDNPEHRLGFFKFLREANEHCFFGLFSIAPHHRKMVVDSIVWAFKHTERNISEAGLEILQQLLVKVSQSPEIAQTFYQQFLLSLIQDVIVILTDRLHKSGFALQSNALRFMIELVLKGQVTQPLFDPTVASFPDNVSFLRQHITHLIGNAFHNLTSASVTSFIGEIFEPNMDPETFKKYLRDFLIRIKEFDDGGENSELFLEEREAQKAASERALLEYQSSVPGLLRPQDIVDDDDL
jgi:exportin-1